MTLRSQKKRGLGIERQSQGGALNAICRPKRGIGLLVSLSFRGIQWLYLFWGISTTKQQQGELARITLASTSRSGPAPLCGTAGGQPRGWRPDCGWG